MQGTASASVSHHRHTKDNRCALALDSDRCHQDGSAAPERLNDDQPEASGFTPYSRSKIAPNARENTMKRDPREKTIRSTPCLA
jgi:hypothetical protein